MLSPRRSRLGTLALVAALGATIGATALPAAAKKARVGGKVSITVPAFNPDTGQSLASGRVKAKRNCDGLRVLRFTYFDANGIPTSSTAVASVVSDSKGRFLVALTPPSSGPSPHTMRIFVEGRKTVFRGRSVRCKPIRSRAIPVPQSSSF